MTLAPPTSVSRGLPLGLTGATAATRYAGATASGAPASGTFVVGDFVIDQAGKIHVCTVAGSPGTFVEIGGGGSGATAVLDEEILALDAASIVFAAIPGTYRHLRIVMSCRSARAASTEDPLLLRFNADAGSNYDYLTFQVLGADSGTATVSRDEGIATDGMRPGTMPAASSPAGAHGEVTIDIANYAGTTFRKGCTSQCMAKLADSTTNVRNWVGVGEWRDTSAITSVTLSAVNANLLAGTIATLYGFDGA